MRHKQKTQKFHRTAGQRKALFKSLAVGLFANGKIKTTTEKAKAVRPFVERLVTHAKKQNVAALRLLLRDLPKRSALRLYHEVAPRYLERKGGYTRVTKLAKIRSDGARMAVLELV